MKSYLGSGFLIINLYQFYFLKYFLIFFFNLKKKKKNGGDFFISTKKKRGFKMKRDGTTKK